MRTFRGGARIGWMNAGYPSAKLSVTASELSISASLLGTVRFAPGDVTAVEPFRWVPFLAQGLRVHHIRPDVPARILFWSLTAPHALAAMVREEGFSPSAPPGEAPSPRPFPFRKPFLVVMFVIWIALLLFDIWEASSNAGPSFRGPGPGTTIGVLLFCATSIAILRWEPARRVALHSPASLVEVAQPLKFIAIITGIVAFVLLAARALGFSA